MKSVKRKLKGLTMPINCDILLGSERTAEFLLPKTRVQSRLEKFNRFSLTAEMHPFLLEVFMKLECKVCKKEIIDYPSANRKYCYEHRHFCSQETKDKIGKIMKRIWDAKIASGYKFSVTRNENISKALTGKKLSKAHCKKIANRMRNKTGCLGIRWKGGRRAESRGYILVYIDKGSRDYEHRKVMERCLGRRLKTKEIIHHINGNKSDNRIENLQLFKNKAEHARFHWYHDERRENGEDTTDTSRPVS